MYGGADAVCLPAKTKYIPMKTTGCWRKISTVLLFEDYSISVGMV